MDSTNKMLHTYTVKGTILFLTGAGAVPEFLLELTIGTYCKTVQSLAFSQQRFYSGCFSENQNSDPNVHGFRMLFAPGY